MAYSCWSTASSARINNYGTRIDLILAAGPCGDAGREFHASVVGADVWMDAHGSDHAPAYADLAPSLRLAMGSLPPPLSSRYLYTGGCAAADACTGTAAQRCTCSRRCWGGEGPASIHWDGPVGAQAGLSCTGQQPGRHRHPLQGSCSLCCILAGKQGNLKAWLASAPPSQAQATAQHAAANGTIREPAPAQPTAVATCLKAQNEASAGASVLGKRPGAKLGSAKLKTAKQRGVAGQSSLKAFMRPQAALKAEQTLPLALISQDSGSTAAEPSLQSQEVTEAQQVHVQIQASSQPAKLEASQLGQRQGLPSMHMPVLAGSAQSGRPTTQPACLGLSQPAGFQEAQGGLQQQSLVRSFMAGAAPMHSCASSGADVDALVDAATRWEEVKGLSPQDLP